MMKLNILNIQDFLDTINACRDEVYMICSNGQKVNIRGQYPIQDELHRQYYDHKNQLQIILEAQNPKDYMRIVSYYEMCIRDRYMAENLKHDYIFYTWK